MSEGQLGTNDFKLKFLYHDKLISPWHDVPLKGTVNGEEIYYFVNEIPLGSRKKMEIKLDHDGNPIIQDIKKGKLREFTYGDIPFNYGALPKTYEDPSEPDHMVGIKGDGDPIDIVEISDTALKMGGVYPIRVLGCLALIDEGEVDWKVVAVNLHDKLSKDLHKLSDLEKKHPEKLEKIFQWFKFYKTTDGKPENHFGLEGKYQNEVVTRKIIEETHKNWHHLVTRQK